ncbi:hypothetical protein ABENE_13650 [Asticcacaulis benevestitus DSM 16100 = ATCC BAA-896]|uniref:Uncharacterized protein n=1 Tax=Asticcacaulis benevestitus DSM 16100 = ATCC BAA-896 TaxID=1121022 RepID=V4P777_9CAUL|nr:hypothetical protein ABENE_13650 [Asticcacaulis benevestitus DSM 16100 = ATCC BAA-896]
MGDDQHDGCADESEHRDKVLIVENQFEFTSPAFFSNQVCRWRAPLPLR